MLSFSDERRDVAKESGREGRREIKRARERERERERARARASKQNCENCGRSAAHMERYRQGERDRLKGVGGGKGGRGEGGEGGNFNETAHEAQSSHGLIVRGSCSQECLALCVCACMGKYIVVKMDVLVGLSLCVLCGVCVYV
jgi:hypothetical protein